MALTSSGTLIVKGMANQIILINSFKIENFNQKFEI